MRFGMITTFYPPYSYGGDGTYVRSLAKSMVALGHEVEIIASTDAYRVRSNDDGRAETAIDEGIKVHRLHHPAGILAPIISHQTGLPGLNSSGLKQFFAKPFDVLHFHNVSLMGAPGVFGMGEARARLLSLHDHWLICPTHVLWKNRERACDRRTCFTCSIRSGLPPQLWRYTGLRDRYLRQIDRILAPTRFAADMHQANGIKEPIEVLPLFSTIDGAAEPPPVRPNRIVFVGRLTALKGIGKLLKVVAGMPDIELLVIGDGELKAELTAAYAAHPNIRFVGRENQEDLAKHYAAANAIVFPSIVPETFGLTLVEAAACGTPSIVAKDSGGAAEIVRTTGGGVLYDGDDELADAIRLLFSDRALRDRLGAMARAGYEANYTEEKHVAGYLRHVDEALHRGP